MSAMRALLTFFSLLLCLAVPIHGFAAVAALEAPCPMEMSSASNSAEQPGADDCCNDMETFAKTGKACKSGQECQTGGLWVPNFLALSTALPVQTVAIAPLSQFAPSANPIGFWRPPTQI